MMMRILSLILTAVQLLVCGVAYGKREVLPTEPEKAVELLQDISGQYPLADTVLAAEKLQNAVQAAFTTEKRRAYAMQNQNMILTHVTKGLSKTATLTDTDGGAYIRSSFDAFYTAGGKTRYANQSRTNARINTIRLGLYEYECHVRDLDFNADMFMLDKAFHVYGDRLYMQYSLYAKEATDALQAFGSEWRIPVGSVAKLQLRDKNGVHTVPDEADADTVEYAAFDIEDVGVVGFIVPPDGGRLTVQTAGDMFILRLYAPYAAGTPVNKFDETGGYDLNYVTFGCRILTDKTHDFAGVDAASAEERTPLRLTVGSNDSGARFIRYNALRGTYDVQIDATDFTWGYKLPDRHFKAPITVQGGDTDRTIWLRVVKDNGGGCLESAALLDETGTLLPVPMQVNKNFRGDYGEPKPYYYTAKDYSYGESVCPLTVHANAPLSCTVVHAYQNWGKAPLKQLSSIEFHTSYYHLSTGVTETNCIAPYFVGDKDGWLLPDFRGRSGTMWAEQPQFNSVGKLFFMRYDRLWNKIQSEYAGSRIASVGQTYADVTLDYTADCGSYTYTLRHLEFPQTDENRTYYTVDIRFDREITFRSFRRDFELFGFNGRHVTFDRFGYLNAQEQPTIADVQRGTHFYSLGSDHPYYSFFSVSESTRDALADHFGCSFGLIVRTCAITRNGEAQNIPLCLRTEAKKDETVGTLTLDTSTVSFRPGDRICLQLVLLPWGTGTEETDDNVRAVREDSALHPVQITAQTGTVIADDILPRVRCENNAAEFTLTGGRNNIAVRADGFTDYHMPSLQKKTADGWADVTLASANGYDGYTVHYNPDGTYGFSFVYTAESPDASVTFRMGKS